MKVIKTTELYIIMKSFPRWYFLYSWVGKDYWKDQLKDDLDQHFVLRISALFVVFCLCKNMARSLLFGIGLLRSLTILCFLCKDCFVRKSKFPQLKNYSYYFYFQQRLMEKIVQKLKTSVETDLFIPLYPRS